MMIVDSPLSSPITTMSTTHSSSFTFAANPSRSHSLASFSFFFPFHSSNNNNNTNTNNTSSKNSKNSNTDLSPYPYKNNNDNDIDDTENVEAQHTRLNAIRNSWYEQFQAPGDPVLVTASSFSPSFPSSSHKQVRRSNTANNIINTHDNNSIINNNISKSPSQITSTTISTIGSSTTPTISFRQGSLGYNSRYQQQHNNTSGGAFLDQETVITWQGLFTSVRQLSHDTSTTGSSIHSSSASTTSLSSSAHSINNEKEQAQKSNKRNSRHSFNHRNSYDASAIRASTGSRFRTRPSSSSRQQLKGITTTEFAAALAASLSATASSSTIDLEKRAMMTTKNPPKKLTILVVGDGAVGKSALTLRFLRDQFTDEYDPTIEDSYCKYIEVDGQDYTLELTDTAGQSEYRDQWDDQFMRTGDGFICVYSIASMSSFQELVGYRDQIWRAKGSRRVPIVITGNKCDLEDGGEREVRTDVGALFAERSSALFVETSAKTGVNIHEMFTELVREIERAQLRASYNNKAGHLKGQYPGHGHAHTHSRSHIYQHHQQRPSTSSSRSRSYRMPPPPPPTQLGAAGGNGSSIRSGNGIAMHAIGAGAVSASSTKGYSTNVTPPATASADASAAGQIGRRSTSSSRRRSTRSGPVVANMGVDSDVQRGLRCCTIM
ncbi:MAG: ras family-domain-containing protein [Linnemannia gamsii]|nr:MAG: ras family-domain-containing protein [Linnemannia gamsii]